MILSGFPLSSVPLSGQPQEAFISSLSGSITLSVQEIDGGFISVIGAGYVPITSDYVNNILYSVLIENPYHSINLY